MYNKWALNKNDMVRWINKARRNKM